MPPTIASGNRHSGTGTPLLLLNFLMYDGLLKTTAISLYAFRQ